MLHTHPPKVPGPYHNALYATFAVVVVATAFLAIAVGTSYWGTNGDEHRGLWKGCVGDVCRDYTTRDCVLAPGPPAGSNCDMFASVKAFAIMSAITSGLAAAILFLLMITWGWSRQTFISPFIMIGMSAAFGLIAMAIYVRMVYDWPSATFGYSFALFTTGWILDALCFAVGIGMASAEPHPMGHAQPPPSDLAMNRAPAPGVIVA